MIVIRCGSAPVPPVLGEHPRVDCSEVPTKDEINTALRELGPRRRMLVCGTDAGLAAVVSRLMRTENLDIEIAYIAGEETPCTRAYDLPTGSAAARLGVDGTARELPLVRDETATAVIGEVTVTGPDAGPLVGETYADDNRVFTGEVARLTVRPSPATPGVRVTAGRRRRRRRGLLRRTEWFEARAVQLGTDAGVVTKDGVTGRRPLKRASFYRHSDSWRLVSP